MGDFRQPTAIGRHTFDGPTGGPCDLCGFPGPNVRLHLLPSEQFTRPARGPRPPLTHSAPLVGVEATSTSAQAALTAFARVGTVRRSLVDLIVRHGPCTDEELERLSRRGHGSVSGATHALRRDGWLEYAVGDDGKAMTRVMATGNPALVLTLTAAARTRLAAERAA